MGLGSAKRETQRRLIGLALLENPRRSDRAIARLVGCGNATVGPVRAALEETVQIERFRAKGGRGIARLVGCSNHTVRPVREALEENEQIAHFKPTRGRRPQKL